MAPSADSALPAPLPSLALAALFGAGIALAGAYYFHRQHLKEFELLRDGLQRGSLRKGRKGERALSGEEEEDARHPRRKKASQSPTRRRRHPPHENGGAFDPFRGGAHLAPGATLPDGKAASAARISSDFSDPSKMPTVSSLPHLGKLERNISEHSRTETPAGGTSANGMPPLPRIATHKLEAGNSLSKSGTRRVQSLQDLRKSAPTSPVKSQFARVEMTDEDDDEAMQAEAEERLRLEAEGEDEAPGNEEEEAERQEEEMIAKKEEQERLNWHVPDPEKGATSADGNLEPDALLKAPEPIAAYEMRKKEEPETYTRVMVTPEVVPGPEEVEVCSMLQECMELRKKYVYRANIPPWHSDQKWPARDPGTHKLVESPFQYNPEQGTEHVFRMRDGVMDVFADKNSEENLFPVPDSVEFFTDLHRVLRIANYGGVKTFCHQRLRLLEQKFNLHLMLNADREFLAQKSAPHRDFYNVRKVDTHVHHSACMNQKHLLRFIKSKLRKEPDEVVIFRDGKYLTLREVFESLDLTGYDLNVDLLDVHADKNTFHRFDKFNLKYNPCGQSRLREIFLKQDNMIQGRFLAELTKEVLSDLAASKYQMAEYRISIYGRKQSEWDQLASWIVNNDLYSDNVVWLIQLPRLYNVYKEMGIIQDFQTMLDNIFIPLFEVTADPASHPQLHVFLRSVAGFDMVDDESKPERRPTKHMQTPEQWNNPFNPAYSYWAYYVWANLTVLNRFRESKGYTTLTFRPHSGEAGDIDHLAATFLTCHNIAHGNNLRKTPSLQYLYYLAQIGLAMSPLSNNSLFLDYHRNPFPMFFARGMNVSLSTDDPLMIHLTKEPLVEEYSIAAQVWKLSACDLCEIARNSVYQSGFQHDVKAHWVGDKYYLRGPDGNDIHKTNVPHMRVEFRHEVWEGELQFIYFNEADIPQEIDC